MISSSLMLYCIVAGGIYLMVISLLLEFIGKKLGVARLIPSELLEPITVSWWTLNFIMEVLFFVAIPTIAYSFSYIILPLSGLRVAMAGALFAFALGMIPTMMTLSVRIKLSVPYLLFILLSIFIKLAGTMVIIGYIYMM